MFLWLKNGAIQHFFSFKSRVLSWVNCSHLIMQISDDWKDGKHSGIGAHIQLLVSTLTSALSLSTADATHETTSPTFQGGVVLRRECRINFLRGDKSSCAEQCTSPLISAVSTSIASCFQLQAQVWQIPLCFLLSKSPPPWWEACWRSASHERSLHD